MPTPTVSWRERWRVLAYTAAVAIGFVVLERLELALMVAFATPEALATIGAGPRDDSAPLAAEAEQVAARSQRPAAPLPPGHRLATFRLGYEVGLASEFVGSFATSSPDVQAKARAFADARLAIAREHARALGVDAVSDLPSRTLQQFLDLNDRLEADENGLAAAVERRSTPRHRHLYLLGAHVGVEAARVESTGGKLSRPPAASIRRHATLAGIAPALWQPLAAEPRGETPEQVLNRYRRALDALGAELARDAPGDVRASNPSVPPASSTR